MGDPTGKEETLYIFLIFFFNLLERYLMLAGRIATYFVSQCVYVRHLITPNIKFYLDIIMINHHLFPFLF